MQVRTKIASFALQSARLFGRALGTELAIELSDHSIDTKMIVPGRDNQAWDANLYKRGNVFLKNYANPIKPVLHTNEDLEDPDTAEIKEGSTETDSSQPDNTEAKLIASKRYQKYMRQDLISQLLTPKEQWKLIALGLFAVAGVQVVTIIILLWANGTFQG